MMQSLKVNIPYLVTNFPEIIPIEIEGSLPCSKQPTTDPWAKQRETIQTLLCSLRSILIVSLHLSQYLPNNLFPQIIHTYQRLNT